MNLLNKKVIVTGGTRGIGKAIVTELANGTYGNSFISDVAFVYNSSDDQAQLLVDELSKGTSKIFAFKADVSSYQKAQETVESAIEKLGGLDILINNAGITRDNLLLRMEESDFDKVIDVNLKSVFNYTKAAIKPMIKQRSGRIINITSVVGLIGNAGQANYAASKSGVIGFTKSIAKELAARGITVNAIAPGFIETEMTEKLNDKQKEALQAIIPMKRFGTPEDIAKVVGFLCSDAADYITGQVLAVDGGMVM